MMQFIQREVKIENPTVQGWYSTDKGKLFYWSDTNDWSCRDDYVSEEHPKVWYDEVETEEPINKDLQEATDFALANDSDFLLAVEVAQSEASTIVMHQSRPFKTIGDRMKLISNLAKRGFKIVKDVKILEEVKEEDCFSFIGDSKIPPSTRAILFICHFSYKPYKLTIKYGVLFEHKVDALNAYGGIKNRESQLIEADTYPELLLELEKFKKNIVSEEWLKELSNCL